MLPPVFRSANETLAIPFAYQDPSSFRDRLLYPSQSAYWIPDDYEKDGFMTGYIITCSSMLADGTGIHTKDDPQRDDIRPYIKDGVVNLYLSWFMM